MATLARTITPSERLSVTAIVVLALGALDFGLEQSLIIPALPALADHYGASISGASWLATGFLLSGTVAVPLFGRLGDVYGKRRLLLIALVAFAVGSLLCALTHSIQVAIAGRIIQGLGLAVAPLTLGLARDALPPHLLTRAVGAVVGAASAGGAIGFVLSGLLVDYVNAASLFWLLFGLAVTLVVALVVVVPESQVRARVAIDAAGAVTLAAGLFALILAISKGNDWGWSSNVIVALFVVAFGLISLFVVVERRVPQPLVDLALVVKKPFAHANVCAFAFGYAFFIAIFLVPQIAGSPTVTGYGQGLSTTEIGLLLVPTSVASFIGAWLGGRVVDHVGPRALIATGSGIGVAAYVSLALAHSSWHALSIPTAALGLGTGLILTGIYPVVLRNTAQDKTVVAVAVPVVMRNTAVAIGLAAAFAIIEGAGLTGVFRSEAGFTRAFVMGAAGAGVALAASMLMPGRAGARAS